MLLRLFFVFLALAILPVRASDYFVDVKAGADGNGSKSQPFATIPQAFASGQIIEGDRLIIGAGTYGRLVLKNLVFKATVEIVTAKKAEVHFDGIEIANSSHLTLRGFRVWPRKPSPSPAALVQTQRDSSDILFDQLNIRSHKSAKNYMSWSRTVWLNRKQSGVLLRGPRNTISRSTVQGTYSGISSIGTGARILANQITGFSGDGLRVLGDNSLVQGNTVQDCFQIDGNHADGFQSWSRDAEGRPGRGIVRDLTIEANRIIEWSGKSKHPLRCSLQGIGLFDGIFQNLVIRNNAIAVRAYHGIAVYGANGAVIVNNTVINIDGLSEKWPWIGVFKHKNGTPPQNITIANNITMAIHLAAEMAQKIRAENTNILVHPLQNLIDPHNGDLRLRRDSPLVDTALSRYAPATDIVGQLRPLGKGPDYGAYEVQ